MPIKIDFKNLKINKRVILLISLVLLVIFAVVLNTTFSDFRKSKVEDIANIKVAGMEYSMHINENLGTIETLPKNKETILNISLTSLNALDYKYELIYNICSDAACNNLIQKPSDLLVEYSSRTIDSVNGIIISNGNKNIRIVITNNSNTTYYIKFDINAGYVHNTLALQNLITTEYNEEDVTIAALIDGEISTTFPTTANYDASVECLTNKGTSNAVGIATWNGSKWIVNVTGADSGKTVCNVEFRLPAPKNWYNAPSGTLLNSLKTTNSVVSPLTSPGKAVSLSNEAVLASAEDDYGTSYYFRGAVENNYVLFADMCWRIVRVNGDGSIKLVLYNYNKGATSCSQTEASYAFARYSGSTYTTTFNASYNRNAYVGFKYGTPGSSTYAAEHANTTKSTILTNLETWYASNLASYESKLADSVWCNDKSSDTKYPYGTTLGYGVNQTGYSTRGRLYADGTQATNAAPTLKCPNDSSGGKLSKFTVADTENGNASLTYKIGLLTVDEAAYAGGMYGTANSTYYLNQNATDNHWWSLSPYYFGGGSAYVCIVNASGNLSNAFVNGTRGLRPAVSLKSTTQVTGSGTSTNPYVVS